jgi:uncharacterized protein (TIGR02246 family)
MRTPATVAIAAAAAITTGAVTVGYTTANAHQTPRALPSTQQIADLFGQWNAALGTLDADKVADRYAPHAVLLPTVSNEVRTDRAQIVDYFQHFLESHPKGTIVKSNIDILDADSAIDSGTYEFALEKDGKKTTVDARYTFVYELINGKWLIVNHHSSAMPEKG